MNIDIITYKNEVLRFMREEHILTLIIAFFVIAFISFTTSQIIALVSKLLPKRKIHLYLVGPPQSGKTQYVNKLRFDTTTTTVRSMEPTTHKLSSLNVLGIRDIPSLVTDVPSHSFAFYNTIENDLGNATHIAFFIIEVNNESLEMFSSLAGTILENNIKAKIYVVGEESEDFIRVAIEKDSAVRELPSLLATTQNSLIECITK